MEKKVKTLWSIILVILVALGFLFDEQITNLIINNRVSGLNDLMVFIGGGAIYFLLIVLVAALFLLRKEKRRYVPVLLFSIVLAWIFKNIISNVVMRMRPELIPLIEPISTFSFPSGHAAIVFSVLAILNKGFRKIGKVWLVIALLVCFSRVYLGVHYLSDVIAGALLGYFVSIISLELEENYSFSRKVFGIFMNKSKKVKKKKRKKRKIKSKDKK